MKKDSIFRKEWFYILIIIILIFFFLKDPFGAAGSLTAIYVIIKLIVYILKKIIGIIKKKKLNSNIKK